MHINASANIAKILFTFSFILFTSFTYPVTLRVPLLRAEGEFLCGLFFAVIILNLSLISFII